MASSPADAVPCGSCFGNARFSSTGSEHAKSPRADPNRLLSAMFPDLILFSAYILALQLRAPSSPRTPPSKDPVGAAEQGRGVTAGLGGKGDGVRCLIQVPGFGPV